MNNNFYGNGQPGGWQTPPQGYNPYDYNYISWYQSYNEKRLLEERKNQVSVLYNQSNLLKRI